MSVGQPRGVEYTDLEKRLRIVITFTNVGTYCYAIGALKFVKVRRVGLALVVRTTSLVGMVENIEFIMITIVTGKDIADIFQNRGLSDTSFSNKKDGVQPFRLDL